MELPQGDIGTVQFLNSYYTMPYVAYKALVRRGYEWTPCHCDQGTFIAAYGPRRICPDCYGDGGFMSRPGSII